MSKQEYIERVLVFPENEERIKEVSEIYETDVNGLIAKIISYADNENFIDDERRAFSYNEILKASQKYDTDFKKLNIIPIIDAYDNDLIVYIIDEQKWAKYNLSDEVLFKKRESLEDVL